MNKQELDELISIGEGYTLEFKRTINDSLGKEICAFANAEGGKILLGVEDSGIISGFNLNNTDSSRIQSYARNMDPAFEVSIEQVENVVVIHVPEGTNKPYSVSGRFYLRIVADSQQMNRNEIREFFQQEQLVLFDQQPNQGFDLQNDFDKFKFDNFLRLANITNNQEKEAILSNLGILKENKLLNAGVLLFAHRITKFFLQAKVKCVLFEGTSRVNIIDKKEFDADLISNYENAFSFIISKLNTKYIIEKERTEKLELPKEAIREALMNALVHRDYNSQGQTQINIFIDKVEITNPGGLVRGLNPRQFGRKSLSRNPLLFDLLNRTKHVEQAGTGINRIKESMKEYDLKAEFEVDDPDSFTISLMRENAQKSTSKSSPKITDLSKEELKSKKTTKTRLLEALLETGEKPGRNRGETGEKQISKLSKTALKILIMVMKQKTITIKELTVKLDAGQTTIEDAIKRLKEEGFLERVGSDREGYWKVLLN